MARFDEQVILARRAAKALSEIATLTNPSAIERDAAIQRFEFTVEATWKAAQHWLRDQQGVVANSPKAAIRACWDAALFDEPTAERALRMVDDRNLTSHTYNEPLAQTIYGRLRDYLPLLVDWIEAMVAR